MLCVTNVFTAHKATCCSLSSWSPPVEVGYQGEAFALHPSKHQPVGGGRREEGGGRREKERGGRRRREE